MITNFEMEELKEILKSWLDHDLVKAGFVFKEVEKDNEAFARGWMMGIYSVLCEIDKINLSVPFKKKK